MKFKNISKLAAFITACALTLSPQMIASAGIAQTPSGCEEPDPSEYAKDAPFYRYYVGAINNAIITSYIGHEETVEIPESLDGVPTELLMPASGPFESPTYYGAFNGNKAIKHVTIPDTITEVGDSTFEGCTNLKSVKLGNSVKTIGWYAFKDTAVETIDLPASVEYIGVYAFDESVKSISVSPENKTFTVKDGVLYRKDMKMIVFVPNSKKGSFTIPDSVEIIGDTAFASCRDLEEVIIPDSVRYIGWNAFEGCDSLKELYIPDSVKSFSSIHGCEKLESIRLPAGIELIPSDFMEYCPSLRTFVIPDTVKKIGSGAFAYCDNLETVEVPSSVEEIDYMVFYSWLPSNEKLTIICDEGSAIHRYAVNNNIRCQTRDGRILDGTTLEEETPEEPTLEEIFSNALFGDIDFDGTVSSSDALNVLRFSAGMAEFNEVEQYIGDMDLDGVITSNDALEILRISTED